MDYLGIILFFLLQLTNVVMSTIRTIVTVKANRHTAAIIAAISYTFYNGIIKLITQQDMVIILCVTFLTNLIGVEFANWLIDRLKKDKLWVFWATVKTRYNGDGIDVITSLLSRANIKYIYDEIATDRIYSLQIFSSTQDESDMIKSILKNYDIKYYIVETK